VRVLAIAIAVALLLPSVQGAAAEHPKPEIQVAAGCDTAHPAWSSMDGGCSKSCRDHPKLSGACFSVRGRMSLWNGTPSVRIWRVGTSRILGVSEQKYYEPGICNLPNSLLAVLDWEKDVFGDFVVCPFAPDRPGVMRLVCVDSASNIVAKNRGKR
jgi:hypothetical protein